jgi:hypothetical protein
MERDVAPPLPWKRIEAAFLLTALVVNTLLFLSRVGIPEGYDFEGHLHAMQSISWGDPFFSLRSHYYACHPPLGFLLARGVTAITSAPPLVAAQIVSFLSSIATLLLLRATLRRLDLLAQPAAVAFLYLTAGLPIQNYLAVTLNLDVIVFAWGAAMLWIMSHLAYSESRRVIGVWTILAGFVGGAAVMTKVSGLLVLAIPALYVAVVRRNILLQARRIALMLVIAVSCALPYYTINYYVPEGTFLFSNAGTVLWVGQTDEARAIRDADPGAFARSLVRPYGEQDARLARTWRSFWGMEDREPQPGRAAAIVDAYLVVMPWLVGVGLLLFILRRGTGGRWRDLGTVVLGYSVLQVLFIVAYIAAYPIDGFFANKGIYIAPASLGIGLLLSAWMETPGLIPARHPRARRWAMIALTLLVALFLVANNLLPVY